MEEVQRSLLLGKKKNEEKKTKGKEKKNHLHPALNKTRIS